MKPIVNQERRDARTIVTAIGRRLGKVYGPVEPPEQCPVLDELIATVLSQNTSDRNSGPAYDELRRRFRDWDEVRRAPPTRIAKAIRQAGLANQKAPRIKAILQRVLDERGELSLEFLHDLPTREAAEYLAGFPGVGPKTVACVLLFACRKPILPVDTHVHRLAQRIGLIGTRTSAVRAHEELARMVPPAEVLQFHIQLIRHGRTACTARKPQCRNCPLLDLCREGRKRLAAGELEPGPGKSRANPLDAALGRDPTRLTACQRGTP
jgi:endonuclease-3